jgi:Zn-dependent protease
MDSELIIRGILFFVPFILSLGVHEWAHAVAAFRLGDNTAKFMGRMSLNPLKHADVFGTFVFPLMALFFHAPFFGWAKPVPVNDRNFKNPIRDMALVAAAGPASNVVLAILFAAIKGILAPMAAPYHSIFTPLYLMCDPAVWVNLFLAFFNLIPIHPLDGGKVLAAFVSRQTAQKLEMLGSYSMFILLFLFISGAIQILIVPVQMTYNLLMHIFVI